MPEICGSPDTDEWLRLKIGEVVELPTGAQLIVVDDDGGYSMPIVDYQGPTKRLHYTFANLEDGKPSRYHATKSLSTSSARRGRSCVSA